jgi:hypothetical protein
VAREVICIFDGLVVVQAVSENLESGVRLSSNSESEFIFFMNQDLYWHVIVLATNLPVLNLAVI